MPASDPEPFCGPSRDNPNSKKWQGAFNRGQTESGNGGASQLKILFSSGSITGLSIEAVFELTRDAGFDGCDLVMDHHFNDPDYRQRVVECSRILPIYSIHAPYAHVDALGDDVQAVTRSVELAKELKSHVVTFHPPSRLSHQSAFLRWFKGVKDFQSAFECGGVALALENMPLTRSVFPVYVLTDYRKLIEFGLARNLYFTYDTTHLASCRGDTIEALLQYLGTGRLRNIHVSDYSARKRRSHLGIGRGDLPITRILNTMAKLGYDGCVTLEMAPHEFPRTKEWLSEVMGYVCSYLRLQLGQDVTKGQKALTSNKQLY
jgi:sugar phosphate isomerase/epimerase